MRVKSKKDRLNGVMAAVAEAIDVPREVLVNEPEVCLQGQSVLTVTNHAGVGAYSESALWVRTAVGPLLSRPWAGEVASAMGVPFTRPSGVAQAV